MRAFKIRKEPAAGLIGDFIATEKARGNWMAGFFWYDIEVISTSVVAGEFIVSPEQPEAVIKPGIFHRTVGLLLLLLTGYLWWFCLRVVIRDMFPVLVGVICVMVASAAITAILVYFFVGKRYSYTLRINGSGISFRRSRVAWDQLAETAIMWKRGRKTRRSWLVLFRRDGRVERLRLAIFDISEDWLATIVEQYKVEAGLEK